MSYTPKNNFNLKMIKTTEEAPVYTPENNSNLQLKRTDAGEVGFRKKLLKDVACCNKTDYQFKFEFSPDSLSAGNGIVIYVEGGCADFTWTITGSDFTLDDATTSVRYNVIRADNATAAGVSETLTVTDSCGTAIEITIICCDANNCCDLADYAFTYSGDDPIELDLDIYKTLTLEGGCSPFYWLSDHEDVSFSDPRYTNQPDNRVRALAGDAYQGTLTIEDECGTSVAIGYTVCCNNPDHEFVLTGAAAKIALNGTVTFTVTGGCPPFQWFSTLSELTWAEDKTEGATNDLTFASVLDSGEVIYASGEIYVVDSCGNSTLGDDEEDIAAIVMDDVTGDPWSIYFWIYPTDCYNEGATTSIELNPSWPDVLGAGTTNAGITTSGTNPLNVTAPADYTYDIYLYATLQAVGYHWADGSNVFGTPKDSISECGCIDDPLMAYDYGSSGATIARGASCTIAITGNNTPFTWSVSGTGFTLDDATTTGLTNTLNADGTACGTATITVTGCDGTVATGYVRCTTGQWTLIDNDVNQVCTLTGACTSQTSSFIERVEGKYKQWEHIAGTLYQGNCDGSCAGCGLCIFGFTCNGISGMQGDVQDEGCCCKSSSAFPKYYCMYQIERRLYEWECAP